MRRLLVKVVGAKDLPESAGARRSCSAEVQLVSELGAPLHSDALHDRTGPPNHFSTVKDTAPVWNAEFVAELPSDLATSGLALRIAVWDEACSPPAALGECLIHANELATVCMREEERTLPLEHPSPPSAAGAMLGASGMLATTSGTATPSIKVRLAYVDVRAAMAQLADAASLTETVAAERAARASSEGATEKQLAIMSASIREEEERANFFWQEAQRKGGPLGGAAALAAREREDARVKKTQEDSATLVAALKEEKRMDVDVAGVNHIPPSWLEAGVA